MHWIALQPQPDAAMPLSPLTDPLTALGWWALQFTPRVALLPGAVLLEVSASTRLWGGRAALLHRILKSNKPLAQVKYAQGATSLIAFGRLRSPADVATAAPDDLPLASLLAAQPHLDTLARLGCRRWGQLRALPRAGVVRRFGAALVDALDQAYGQRPDVYPWLTLPEAFEGKLELPSPVDSAAALLFGGRRLLAQLQLWLQLRQQGVLAIELGWTLDARRHTERVGALVLRTAEPASDTAHLQRLLAEHLSRVTLPAPALALRLRSLQTQRLAGISSSLLPEEQLSGDSLAQTLERLSARLGPERVLRLQARADHRPEHMQVWQNAIVSGAIKASGIRAGGQKQAEDQAARQTCLSTGPWAQALYPTWLLAEPLKLALHQQQPCYQGPLTLLSGPQRLESGWWAEPPAPQACAAATLRDYFVARSDNSPLLWIYRERLSGTNPAQPSADWYLHGVFA